MVLLIIGISKIGLKKLGFESIWHALNYWLLHSLSVFKCFNLIKKIRVQHITNCQRREIRWTKTRFPLRPSMLLRLLSIIKNNKNNYNIYFPICWMLDTKYSTLVFPLLSCAYVTVPDSDSYYFVVLYIQVMNLLL